MKKLAALAATPETDDSKGIEGKAAVARRPWTSAAQTEVGRSQPAGLNEETGAGSGGGRSVETREVPICGRK
jgi:hypothetical protein